jgi:hypothetical protein
VDTLSDPANCGVGAAGCGNVCPLANDVCAGGACACPGSLPDVCGTSCVNRQTDERHCGTCGNACPSGATCTGGGCACDVSRPQPCGATCCAGSGCCAGNACQTEHSNGLGQHYYDCSPLYVPGGATTRGAAFAAADAWAAGTTYDGTVCDPYCIARRTASQCAVWCYGDSPLAGRVKLTGSLVCRDACPYADYATWD